MFNIEINTLKNLTIAFNDGEMFWSNSTQSLNSFFHNTTKTISSGSNSSSSTTKPVIEPVEVDYGIYDCHSKQWNQVFEDHPTPDNLFLTYMDSSAEFLQTGLYMFCSDIRSGD